MGIRWPDWPRLLARAFDAKSRRKFASLYARQPDPYEYDRTPFELERRERMLALLRLDGRSRVLEAGCAGGFITEGLARAGARVDAMDIADGAVAAARARLDKARLSGNVSFERGSLASYEPPREAYDAIVVAEVLYYLGGRNALMRALGADAALLDSCLKSLLAGLKPGGLLLLAHSYPEGERASRETYGKRAAALGATIVSEETLRSDAENRSCLLVLLSKPRPPAGR